jgi:hypothetical protein
LTSKSLRAFGTGRRWASVSTRSTYSSTPPSSRLARLLLHSKSLALASSTTSGSPLRGIALPSGVS